MSWKDEEIDKLYQESAENHSIEYKNEYWKEMEALLPESRGRDFLWFFTAFLFIGIVGVNSFINSPIMSDAKIAQSTNENQNIADAENINEKDVNSISANNSVINNQKENSIASITVAKKDEQSNNNSSKESTPLKKSTFDYVLNEPIQIKSLSIKKNLILATEDKVQKTNNTTSHIDNEIGNLPIRTLDISSPDHTLMVSPPYEGKTSSYVDFYGQVIGGISQSLSIPSDNYSYSYGFGFGAQFHKGQFQFTTGINALVSNHSDLQLNRSAKVYGFGSDLYNFNIDYKQIYSLNLLLTAGYQLGRHQINAGLRPSFAYSSQVQVSELSMDDAQSIVNNSETREVYGYMGAINQFGLKPMLGYSFKLSPTISIGANIGIQLMPSIKEDFLTGSNRVYPIDGQIYFRKSFSIKR